MKMWTWTRGEHWPRRGYGDAALKTPFSRLSCRSQGSHFKQKSQFTRPPFDSENLEILACTASIFTQIIAHKPPNLEIFSSQAPKFGNFPLTSPPFQRHMSVRKPHTSEIRRPHTPTWKKSWVPPRGPGSLVVISSTAYLLNLFPDDPVYRPTSVHIPFTLFSSQINGHLKTLWLYPGTA